MQLLLLYPSASTAQALPSSLLPPGLSCYLPFLPGPPPASVSLKASWLTPALGATSSSSHPTRLHPIYGRRASGPGLECVYVQVGPLAAECARQERCP